MLTPRWRPAVAVLAAAVLAALGSPAVAADPAASPFVTTGVRSAVVLGDDPGAASPSDDPPTTQVITFSEFPVGTVITDQYQSRGIVFEGVDPFILEYSAMPSSPVLTASGGSSLGGRFVAADGSPRTVDRLTLTVGYLATRSVRLRLFDLEGQQLLSQTIPPFGIVTWPVSQPGMASFQIEPVGAEPYGFAIDDVTFLMAPDVVHVDTFVALGDSFQSGQGVGNYEPGTDADGNGCRRSYGAYPYLLVRRGVTPLTLDFRACSGATMRDFYHPQKEDQPPQLEALNVATRLVTVGVGGNDINFAPALTECIGMNVGLGVTAPGLNWWRSCARNQGPAIDEQIADLRSGQLGEHLSDLYADIRRRAPNARIVAVDYPQFFAPTGVGGPLGCTGVRSSDQVWLNEKVRQANDAIASVAARAGFEHVSMTSALAGHHLCAADAGLNGVSTDFAASLHPNALGHGLMADRLADTLGHPVRPDLVVRPRQIQTMHYSVSGQTIDLNVSWVATTSLEDTSRNSARRADVVTALISPSGLRYSREFTRDAEHENGPTYEHWTITDPEPGEWTVETFGADVPEEGLAVRSSFVDGVALNQPPLAVMTITPNGLLLPGSMSSSGTYTFDASASMDLDGHVVDYEWDFGDGTTASGPVVTHSFAPGSYDVALVVTDDEGAIAFGFPDDVLTVAPGPMMPGMGSGPVAFP